eukprot:s1076_g3.t2
MRLNLFPYLCASFFASGSCQSCPGRSCTSDDLANFMQFMPVDAFADVKNGRHVRELQKLISSTETHHERMEAPTAQFQSRDRDDRDRNITFVKTHVPAMLTRLPTDAELEKAATNAVVAASTPMNDANLVFYAEDPAANARGHHDTRDWITVYALLAVIVLALSPIAFQDSWRALLLVMVYLASVTLVKVFVKETIRLGFAYSETITSMHMISVSLVVLCFERPNLAEALPVLPIAVLNGFSVLTNNKAFLYGGVAFVSMVAANVPFVTFCLETLKGKRNFTFMSVFAVSLVCAGSVCCVRGEPQASLTAFLFAAVSAVLRSARGVWQHELVSVSPRPLLLVFWNGFWTWIITLITMVFSEGFAGIRHLSSASWEAKVALFCSIVAAVLLNITQWFAMKTLGALMSSIVGNLNLVLVIALSTAWLHELVTPWQYVGVGLLCAGTFGNKVQDVLKKRWEQKPCEAPEPDPPLAAAK